MFRRVLFTLGAALVFAVLFGGNSNASPTTTDQLGYTIRTRYDAGQGCAGERVKAALVGVPTAVDVGGTILPDLVVELAVVPPLPGVSDTTTLNLVVTKLTAGPLPVLVEAILAPNGADSPDRVAFGYDACAATAPALYRSTILAQPTRLSVDAYSKTPGSTLTVLGSTFRQVGENRVDPTAVSASLTPVPSTVTAVIDELGGGRYQATLTPSAPTKVTVGYQNVEGASSTTVNATVDQVPGPMDLTFSSTAAAYTAPAPIEKATVNVTSKAPGARTTRVSATLVDLPVAASFTKDGDTHVMFTADGRVGDAKIRLASFEPGTSLPATPTSSNQYLVAESRLAFDVVDLRVRGLATADAGWGDPIAIDVDHRAGPFDLAVRTDDGTTTAAIRDLPGQVAFTYSPASQALDYAGSGVIGELTLDHHSDEPMFETATDAHVVARQIPTGLSFSFDEATSSMNAAATGGSLGLLEAQLTSGPDERVADGVDGLLLADRVNSYTLFARLSGLVSLDASWGGDPTRADLQHRAGPFDLTLIEETANDVGDISTHTRELRARDLPASCAFEFTSSPLTYTGSCPIDQLEYDDNAVVVSQRSMDAHLLARGIPATLTLRIDMGSSSNTDAPAHCTMYLCETDAVSIDTGGVVLGLLELQLTTEPDVRLPADKDGFLQEKRDDFDGPNHEPDEDAYIIFARMTGLRRFDYAKTVANPLLPYPNDEFRITTTEVNVLTEGGRPLVIDVKDADEEKPGGVEYVRAELDALPGEVTVKIFENAIDPFFGTVLKYDRYTYTASEQADSLTFETNAGEHRSRLAAVVEPVPTSAGVCLADGNDVCLPFTTGDEQHDVGSQSIDVGQPAHIELTDCKEVTEVNFCEVEKPLMQRTTVDLQMDKRLAARTARHDKDNYFDPADLVIDTGGQSLRGTIKQIQMLTFPGVQFELVLPKGFMAADRYVRIGLAGDGHFEVTRSRGTMSCPSDTRIAKRLDVLGVLDFAEEVCPAPVIESVELDNGQPAVLRPGETATIHIRGRQFSPRSCTGDWPPCLGPEVKIGEIAPTGFVQDPSITINSIEWLALDHVVLSVTVASDADSGSRDVFMRNPIEDAGLDLCFDCFEVRDPD